MQPGHVPFGVVHQRDKAVLAEGELFLEDLSAIFRGAARFDGAILAVKINFKWWVFKPAKQKSYSCPFVVSLFFRSRSPNLHLATPRPRRNFLLLV
jgi:hypothetical protein